MELVELQGSKGRILLPGMGKYLLMLAVFFIFSCNNENAPDCLQNAGDLVRVEVSLPSFTSITVFERVALVLREGPEQRVEIETGEFLLNEVSAEVEGDRLLVRNENNCNLFRDFELTTIYVTAPNITEIRSSTGLPISSDGTLGFPSLRLLSESFSSDETDTTSGSFNLQVATQDVSITTNGVAFFELRGTTENLNITIAAGDSRLALEDLTAQNVSFNHRGSNDILVNPQQSLEGVIRGNGNVISFNRPPVVEVEEIFNGRLIFRD